MTSPASLVGRRLAGAPSSRRALGDLDRRLAEPRPLLAGHPQRPFGEATGEPGGPPQLVGQRADDAAEHVERPGRAVGGAGQRGRTVATAGPPVGVGVEQRRHQLGAGAVVDRRDVDLGVQRDPVVAEPLDDPQLPQRARPVERDGVDVADDAGRARPRRRLPAVPCGARGTRGRSRGRSPTTAGRGRAAPRPPRAGPTARAAAARRRRRGPRRRSAARRRSDGRSSPSRGAPAGSVAPSPGRRRPSGSCGTSGRLLAVGDPAGRAGASTRKARTGCVEPSGWARRSAIT